MGGISKGWKREKFHNIVQYFAVGKTHIGRKRYRREWEPEVHGTETGSSDYPAPHPSLPWEGEWREEENFSPSFPYLHKFGLVNQQNY